MNQRIYLDHAATSVPKPAATVNAMMQQMLHHEASVGRGAYRSSVRASAKVAELRAEIARWINAPSANEITLQSGGTEALNLGLFGLLRPGDHVVTCAAEHNSVLRPIHELSRSQSVDCSIVDVDGQGLVSVESVMNALRPNTRIVSILHAANVNGVVQPIAEIGAALTQQFEVDLKPILMTDAAQSFGYLPIDVQTQGIDCLAAPGHKGGQGPLGTGFMYLNQRYHSKLRPIVFGGTGSQSDDLEMPMSFPSSFEAGNMNVPAMAGWLAGLASCRGEKLAADCVSERYRSLGKLAEELYLRLERIPGVRVIGRPDQLRLPIASIEVDGMGASEVAAILDSEFGIEVRSGLHCAALIHQAIGSPTDGTLRISCGVGTTLDELDALSSALEELLGVIPN
ncbi:aminotransferase class V-fold PLP-dependent enzyme [Roseiconus sp. JC912]|uniref:aminotransferase class V-fold PLP-dependent enzyme n=1 Tax=Roseiconus sp. JC912 TaxID=3396307 RepID=UPI003A4C5C4F